MQIHIKQADEILRIRCNNRKVVFQSVLPYHMIGARPRVGSWQEFPELSWCAYKKRKAVLPPNQTKGPGINRGLMIVIALDCVLFLVLCATLSKVIVVQFSPAGLLAGGVPTASG
jgi:hypothetical protein